MEREYTAARVKVHSAPPVTQAIPPQVEGFLACLSSDNMTRVTPLSTVCLTGSCQGRSHWVIRSLFTGTLLTVLGSILVSTRDDRNLLFPALCSLADSPYQYQCYHY